jgi:replicative superfamily II helicase
MFTYDFPYYRPPFPRFNVVQSAVVPHIDKDVNIVAAFATASGKSVLAECAFGFHLSTNSTARVSYVCPFRGLGNQKYREWKENEQLSQYGVVISTGDHGVSVEKFLEGRLSIVTSESFDSKMRNPKYRDWTRSQSCIVIDEAHVLGERNGAIETSLMSFTAINPGARVILLSATLGNAKELASWLKSLNGKQTKCFTSDWRPTKIETELHVVDDGFKDKIDKAVELASENTGKIVIFVHSRAVGAEICKRLKSIGVRSAFHNASLSLGMRNKIERVFADENSGLNTLVSTSTLSAGVNI